jgi:hypothetical protein
LVRPIAPFLAGFELFRSSVRDACNRRHGAVERRFRATGFVFWQSFDELVAIASAVVLTVVGFVWGCR